jgi:galactose oxidase-like protein
MPWTGVNFRVPRFTYPKELLASGLANRTKEGIRMRRTWILALAVMAATAAVVVPTLPARGGTNSSQSPRAAAPAKGAPPLWTNETSSVAGTPPSPRSDAAFTNDPLGGYDVLFGGQGAGGTILGDTWALFGGNWVNLPMSVSPSPRAGAALTFDKSVNNYLILFGGVGSNGQVLGDTWSFVGGKWVQLHPTISPPPRQLATMIFSPADNEMLLFGGTNATKTTYYQDSWAFKNGQWSQISPATSPPARAGAGMVYDSTDGYVVMFGGSSAGGDLGDTWRFKGAPGATWTQLSPNTSPPARDNLAMIDDPGRKAVLLFGGFEPSGSCGSEVGDTWQFSAGNWTKLSLATSPPPRQGAGIAYQMENGGTVVLFGGLSGQCDAQPTYLGDTWEGN